MCNKMCDVSDFVKRCYCKYYTLGRIRSPKDYNNSGYECDFFSHILMNNAIFRKNVRYTRKSHMKNYHWEGENCLSIERHQLICTIGQVNFSLSKYIMAIYLSLDK